MGTRQEAKKEKRRKGKGKKKRTCSRKWRERKRGTPAPGARKYVGPRLVGGTKTRHGFEKREFRAQEGRYITGRRNNQPPTRVAFASTDRSPPNTQTRAHPYNRSTPPLSPPLTTPLLPPPFDRRRSARKREGRHRFPLTLQGLIYIFFPGAESRFTSIRGNTIRATVFSTLARTGDFTGPSKVSPGGGEKEAWGSREA